MAHSEVEKIRVKENDYNQIETEENDRLANATSSSLSNSSEMEKVPLNGCETKNGNATEDSTYLRPMAENAAEIEPQKSSTTELKALIDVLTLKYSALETRFAQIECENRTLERDVAFLQSENDRTKRKCRQISSEFAQFVGDPDKANTPKVKTVQSDDVTRPDKEEEEEKERNARTERMQNELESSRTEVARLEKEVVAVTSVVGDLGCKVAFLESELQKYMRRHSLIVENLCPKEDKSASAMFLVFVNSVLGVAVDDSDLESLHVVQSGQSSPEKRPRPILVTFTCYGTCARLYKAWLAFRSAGAHGAPGALSGERGQGIRIREYLADQQEHVYQEALVVRDRQKVKDCWTFKGRTYVRTLDGNIREFLNKEEWIPKTDNISSGCVLM